MIMAEQALLIQISLTCDLRNWPCLSRCAFDLDQIEALYQMDLPPRPAHERPNRTRSEESAVRSAHLPFPDKENCRCLVLGTIQDRVLTQRDAPRQISPAPVWRAGCRPVHTGAAVPTLDTRIRSKQGVSSSRTCGGTWERIHVGSSEASSEQISDPLSLWRRADINDAVSGHAIRLGIRYLPC